MFDMITSPIKCSNINFRFQSWGIGNIKQLILFMLFYFEAKPKSNNCWRAQRKCNLVEIYRVLIKYCVFFRIILESLPPLPHQHSAASGCTKNYQLIGVTIHSHCVESFEGLLQRCRRGRGCSELWKNTFFPEHPV